MATSNSTQYTTLLAGSTGLVGSQILTTLLNYPSTSPVHAFTRKELPNTIPDPQSRLQPIIAADSSTWPSDAVFPASANAKLFLSALGTTRAQAGGLDKQRQIDYDLNLALAKKAHASGASVYVLISSSGADSSSMFPYMKMKGELEDAVGEIGFDKVVILRPGLLVGTRKDSRPPEFVMQKTANLAGKIGLKNFWAVDADVVGKAAVRAGVLALEKGDGVPESKTWIVPHKDVWRLGHAEWDKSWSVAQ